MRSLATSVKRPYLSCMAFCGQSMGDENCLRSHRIYQCKSGALLQVGAAVTGDEADNPGENHRTNNGYHDADDKTVLSDSPESDEAG